MENFNSTRGRDVGRPSISTYADQTPTPPETLVQVDSHLERGQGPPAASRAGRHSTSKRAFLSQLPTWQEFIREEWKDLVPMAATVLITEYAMPRLIGNRYFPLPLDPADPTRLDTSALLASAYPYRTQIIPVWLSAFLALVPAWVIFALFQLKMKSWPDFHASFYGLLTTLVWGTVFQIVCKTFIGGLRPYFYDACKPDMERVIAGGGIGLNGVMFDKSICTGEWGQVRQALTGWPSGHSNAAAGSATFLSVYLNAKLKIFADARGRFWKMAVFFLPLVIGTALCAVLTLDQSHTWYDILTGALIGVICALASYRLRYAAIWDFRFNHIPLPKSSYKVKADGLHMNLDGASRGGAGNAGPKKRSKFAKRFGSRYVKRSQRFTYDLPTIASQEAPLPQASLSSPNSHSHVHSTKSHLDAANALNPRTIPNHPLYPVMTRRWQGSGIGAPGDASWHGGVQGTLGQAHAPREYGRDEPGVVVLNGAAGGVDRKRSRDVPNAAHGGEAERIRGGGNGGSVGRTSGSRFHEDESAVHTRAPPYSESNQPIDSNANANSPEIRLERVDGTPFDTHKGGSPAAVQQGSSSTSDGVDEEKVAGVLSKLRVGRAAGSENVNRR